MLSAMAKRELTSRQKYVLQWISDGCPSNDWLAQRYKQSARMLAGYGLVKITGHSTTWKATITERGLLVLSGDETLVPESRKNSSGPHDKTSSGQTAQRPSPPAPRRRVLDDHSTAEAVADLYHRLTTAEFHIVRGLPLDTRNDEAAVPDWKYITQRIRSYTAVQDGSWRVSTRTRAIGRWYRDQREVLDVALIPEDRWLSDSPEVVTSRDRIARYHPAVSKVMAYATNISPSLKPRARRLLHSLFREAEARGWEHCSVHTGGYCGYTARERGSLTIHDTGYGFSDGHHSYFVSVSEGTDRVERPPTSAELKRFESTLRWSPNATLGNFYDHTFNGKLIVTVGSKNAKDTKRWSAETALQKLFATLNREWVWDEYDREMTRRKEEKWRRKLAIGEAQADGIIRDRSFHESLEKRASALESYRRSCTYLSELRTRLSQSETPSPGALEWLTWCEAHLAEKDPFRDVRLPEVTPLSATERNNLVTELARKIPDSAVD